MEFVKDTKEALLPKAHPKPAFTMTNMNLIKKLASNADREAERKRNHIILEDKI